MMRHFLRRRPLASPVPGLALGVVMPALLALLVATAGLQNAPPSSLIATEIRAVSMPPVAPRADVDHLTTEVAHEAAGIWAQKY